MTTSNTKVTKKENAIFYLTTLIASLMIHYAYFSQAIPEANYLHYLACNALVLISFVAILLSKKIMEEQFSNQATPNKDFTHHTRPI